MGKRPPPITRAAHDRQMRENHEFILGLIEDTDDNVGHLSTRVGHIDESVVQAHSIGIAAGDKADDAKRTAQHAERTATDAKTIARQARDTADRALSQADGAVRTGRRLESTVNAYSSAVSSNTRAIGYIGHSASQAHARLMNSTIVSNRKISVVDAVVGAVVAVFVWIVLWTTGLTTGGAAFLVGLGVGIIYFALFAIEEAPELEVPDGQPYQEPTRDEAGNDEQSVRTESDVEQSQDQENGQTREVEPVNS